MTSGSGRARQGRDEDRHGIIPSGGRRHDTGCKRSPTRSRTADTVLARHARLRPARSSGGWLGVVHAAEGDAVSQCSDADRAGIASPAQHQPQAIRQSICALLP